MGAEAAVHDIAEGLDGDVVVRPTLEGLVVLVVLHDVLKVADETLVEVRDIARVRAVNGLTEPTT